ncbi:ABC transporter ATP-binding protein [Adlercreutzia murintestinalis]|uniref:ABC transporter ATP-binding protein n=1 Tax=Adlercreutzia murintestinalis TaxID=2941325 RepID=UPI0020426044|nr:ABC transporter ATP-binding protein [Adlercreutzia murintestinalis]
MPLAECIGVEKTYGSGAAAVHALRGVDLSIEAGEYVAIMGASGSGKSTLLHIMGGIDVPTAGQALVDGQDVSTLDATQAALFRRRKVGIVYQFFNLVPTTTVKRNILMPLLLDRREVDPRFFTEIVEALGLASRLDAMPSELSGGQQQRVAIARALIYRPMLLLADEPTGNLDQRTSREIIDLLKLAHRSFHQTTVIVTHDEAVALKADRVIVMEDGRLISDESRR